MRFFKLLFVCLVSMVMFTTMANAQDAILSQGTYKSVTAIYDGDTIEGTSMEVGKTILVDKSQGYGYRYQASADSLNAAGTVLFILKGGITEDNMQPIDTVTWYLTSADTTVLFDQRNDTENWRYIGVFIKGTDAGTKAKLGTQHLKLLLK